MKKFQKFYIGKGTQVENLDIVTINIDMEEAEKFIFEYDGKKYLRFEVAKMQETSQYGKTHTCYVSKLVEEPALQEENLPDPGKPARSRKK